jgi:hypothetical protein
MDVPGMVPEELLLEVLHDQFHLILKSVAAISSMARPAWSL